MMSVEPTGAVLGATIHGVDLSKPMQRTFGRILHALGHHGVLRFPDQDLDRDAAEFSALFGEIQGPSTAEPRKFPRSERCRT